MYVCMYVLGFEELSAIFIVIIVIIVCGGEVGSDQREAEVQTAGRPTLAQQ